MTHAYNIMTPSDTQPTAKRKVDKGKRKAEPEPTEPEQNSGREQEQESEETTPPPLVPTSTQPDTEAPSTSEFQLGPPIQLAQPIPHNLVMAMSTDTSPQHAGHLPPPFHSAPMAHHPGHPGHHMPHHMAPNPYHDSSAIAKDEALGQQGERPLGPPGLPPHMNGNGLSLSPNPTPTKGKNGATGPADGKTKPHICQICNRGFTTGGHLQRHQRIHTGVKAFRCPFPGCETRTSRQDNLQQQCVSRFPPRVGTQKGPSSPGCSYRTHLSPTLRRGSGSAARAAVNAAMEAAGLKSTATRAPRKSKGSAVGTPSSATSAASHVPSPYQTPTSQGGPGPMPYGAPYMYDPQQHGYPPYGMPHPMAMGQAQSANSSRVPSPVNGHSSAHSSVGSMPSAHHQQYFNQFAPSYYPGMQHQPYRYGPGPGVPSPYGTAPHPHHGIYSSGMVPDHQQYAQMQHAFPQHGRDAAYGGGVIAPGGYGQNPMANGYPPRTQTSTPLSQSHEADDRYRRGPSPRRRTPSGSHDMLTQGVVDPSHMSTNRQPGGMPPAYAGYGGPAMGYGYPAPPSMVPHGGAPDMSHRASISSLSDGGSGGGSAQAQAPGATGDADMKGEYQQYGRI